VKVQFTVGGKPQGKQRPRLGKGGRVYTPAATKRYERMVKWSALEARPRGWKLTGRFRVEVACYFPDERRRDCDNVLKSVMDALNRVLYNDDSQVTIARVLTAVDRERPRTEVVVWAENHT
jgi:Holliday junction resolvase RusA-like endonuclease